MIFTKVEIFFALWISYIAVHYFVTYPHEEYRTLFLCASLTLTLAMSVCFRFKIISINSVDNITLIGACIHILYMLAQSIGLAGPGNAYFRITGCNENPTATALYLVITVPILIKWIKNGKRKWWSLVFLLVVLLALKSLRCRTAYIGLAVEMIILMVYEIRKHGLLKRIGKFYVWTALLLLAVIASVCSVKMYTMKKDSADGRVLVWKLSAEAVADKPLGHGYGLFGKFYNERQARYFCHRHGNDSERRNANFVFMSYNDYLEHVVEGCIIGMCFLVMFYVLMIRRAAGCKDIACLMVCSAFAVMSLTNFVYSSIQSWLCLMLYSGYCSSISKGTAYRICHKRAWLAYLLAALSALIALKDLRGLVCTQYKLKELSEVTDCDDKEFGSIEDTVGTSEAFWTYRAKNCMMRGNFTLACSYLDKASCFTASPSLLYMKYSSYKEQNMNDRAAACLHEWHNTVPSHLRPMFYLMNDYCCSGKADSAVYYAREILNTECKGDSEVIAQIKAAAENIINRNNEE